MKDEIEYTEYTKTVRQLRMDAARFLGMVQTINKKPITARHKGKGHILAAGTAMLTGCSCKHKWLFESGRLQILGYWTIKLAILHRAEGFNFLAVESGGEIKAYSPYSSTDFSRLPGRFTPWRHHARVVWRHYEG